MTESFEVPPPVLRRILDDGLRPGPRLVGRVRELWAGVGPTNLFFGVGTRVALAVVVSALVLALAAGTVDSLAVLFACAPLLLLTLIGFVEGAERTGPLAELRRTLPNSGPQLAAFRSLVFAVAGLGSGLLVSVLPLFGTGDAGRRVLVGSLSVSLSALCTLALHRPNSARWVGLVLPVAWISVWLLAAIVLGDRWEAVLESVPDVLGWAAVVVGATVFVHEVRRQLLEIGADREVTHAAG